jgi:hypothetical protein
MPKRKPTGHIFSKKTRERNKRIESPEYFEQHVLPNIMNTDDIRKLSNPEIRGFKNYLREQQKKIAESISSNPDLLSSQKAQDDRITTQRLSNDPVLLLETFMRQNQYFNELETDIDFEVNRSDFKEAEEQMTESTANKAAELIGIDPNDKWTILRRLATIDNRLNIDRAYASDTLKQIEDLIASGDYKDINEITAELMEEVKATGAVNAEWDKEMQPLSIEDLRLIGNKGFHGVDKAIAVAKRKEQARKWDISNFAPMWETPKPLPNDLPF